ncbi:uncharacterized protein AKAME5_002187200 [Lates japonicus]|uniref:Uncharacterized protein n=1 Tax=Lates japonicus TaxID=270547 RepID=A0AAD3NEF4_LATJO|nr:uncharacterized protein AKAME5_002187200 [Lates japonicus]
MPNTPISYNSLHQPQRDNTVQMPYTFLDERSTINPCLAQWARTMCPRYRVPSDFLLVPRGISPSQSPAATLFAKTVEAGRIPSPRGSTSRTDSTELTNRWRVTDYSSDGHTLMSVLCQFTEKSAQCAMTQSKREREETTSTSTSTTSSSFSPPKKRLRV